MKQLVPPDDLGVFAGGDCIAWTDSQKVAINFGKRHDHVLRDIEIIRVNLTQPEETESEINLPKSGEIENGENKQIKSEPVARLMLTSAQGEEFFRTNFILSHYRDTRDRKRAFMQAPGKGSVPAR